MAYRVALIPGDGIGLEVIPEGVRVLNELSRRFSFQMAFTEFPYSCQYYFEHGVMMPEDAIEKLRPFDAILLGAVGLPKVPDHVSLWGLLIPIRRSFGAAASARDLSATPVLELDARANSWPDRRVKGSSLVRAARLAGAQFGLARDTETATDSV